MEKTMTTSTQFYRNPLQLFTVFEECRQRTRNGKLKVDFFGCSNGSEVYTFLMDYLIRKEPFALEISGYDIVQKNIDIAIKGDYQFPNNVLPSNIPWYATRYFKRKTNSYSINIDYPVRFEVKDICNQDDFAGMEQADISSIQNVLIHMDRDKALQGLNNVYDHTKENGLLLLAGCDQDVLSEFAQGKGLIPITNNIRIIHESWAINRRANPSHYWHLAPLDDTKSDWQYRYCTIFQKRSL
jgi:chemotaxis methyl-accepting protein methylase